MVYMVYTERAVNVVKCPDPYSFYVIFCDAALRTGHIMTGLPHVLLVVCKLESEVCRVFKDMTAQVIDEAATGWCRQAGAVVLQELCCNECLRSTLA